MGRVKEVFKHTIDHFKEHGFKGLSKHNIKVYLTWVKNVLFGARIPEDELVSYSQQVVYRMLKCPDCVAAGKCKSECACDMPEKATIPEAECELGFWGQMKKPEEWKVQMKEDGINFLMTGK